MDEKPNVNNLNGIPNFGHGFPVVEEPVVEEPKIEEAPKKKKKAVDSAD